MTAEDFDGYAEAMKILSDLAEGNPIILFPGECAYCGIERLSRSDVQYTGQYPHKPACVWARAYHMVNRNRTSPGSPR
jgi:hypothetical protein